MALTCQVSQSFAHQLKVFFDYWFSYYNLVGSGVTAQNTTNLKNKSLTLPLMGTTSPVLVVPSQEKSTTAATTVNAMKTQTIPRLAVKNATNTPTPTKSDESNSELNRVGQSVFYDCIDANTGNVTSGAITNRTSADGVEEKQDVMKPERNDTDEESEF